MATLPSGRTYGGSSSYCPPSEARAPARAFVFPAQKLPVTYLAYLDEFGQIGPYVRREDP